ncbi:MAG: ABC transporter permease [Bacteroidaceae bacterium]|nr:ABC transporter permease [Bacteroidaceae bacterium]
MFKIYFRQAWNLVKQNKLFTSIYVIGTGLAIALTMILFIVHYIKFAPVYPEENRGETLVIRRLTLRYNDDRGMYQSNCCSPYLGKYLKEQTRAEAVAVFSPNTGKSPVGIGKPGEANQLRGIVKLVNADFWKLFTFQFIDGKPFTEVDVDSKQQVAVIQEEIALQLFGRTDVTGERIQAEGQDVKIVGVVKNSSVATPDSYAAVWIPISLDNKYSTEMKRAELLGRYQVYLKATSGSEKEILKQEVIEAFRKYDADHPETTHELKGQPVEDWLSYYQHDEEVSVKEVVLELLYLLLALLFIPALNLSGMISSRMDQRQVEIGVRKAYGASNWSILRQVLGENLALTVAGGIVGLLIAYLIIATCSQWILSLFDNRDLYSFAEISPRITPEMLFSPWIIGCAFGACLLLNLISALIPTVWALRHSIIESLHSKQ